MLIKRTKLGRQKLKLGLGFLSEPDRTGFFGFWFGLIFNSVQFGMVLKINSGSGSVFYFQKKKNLKNQKYPKTTENNRITQK